MTAKITLKSLQAEVNLFRGELRNIKEELSVAKNELKSVKKEMSDLKDEYSKKEQGIQEINWSCKSCESSFNSKKLLKKHMQTEHTKTIYCRFCPETFEKNCELEIHMKTKHEQKEKFECDQCGKHFVLKWRLRCHQEIHAFQPLKKCHYYNNGKICPYEDLG